MVNFILCELHFNYKQTPKTGLQPRLLERFLETKEVGGIWGQAWGKRWCHWGQGTVWGSLLERLWAGVLMTTGWFSATTGSPTDSVCHVPLLSSLPAPPLTRCLSWWCHPWGQIGSPRTSAQGPIGVHMMPGGSGPTPSTQG